VSDWELPVLDGPAIPKDAPTDGKRQTMLYPIGWSDRALMARLSYRRFDDVVRRAVREVLRHAPTRWAAIDVSTISAEGPYRPVWGEFFPPNGPIVLYHIAYELMPDEENYYRQIKAVLVHEFEHSAGEMHGEPVRFRAEAPLSSSDMRWINREDGITVRTGGLVITLPDIR